MFYPRKTQPWRHAWLKGVLSILGAIAAPAWSQSGTTSAELSYAISNASTARDLLANLPPQLARLGKPVPEDFTSDLTNTIDYQAWRANAGPLPTAYDLLDSLSAQFHFRYHLYGAASRAPILEVVSMQNSKEFFCDKSKLDAVLPTLTVAGKGLRDRSNVEFDDTLDPTIRITGHPLAIAEISRAIKEGVPSERVIKTPEELARQFGVYETGKASSSAEGESIGGQSVQGPNLSPQETNAATGEAPGRPSFSEGLGSQPVKPRTAPDAPATRLIGRMVVRTFQLKHATVESQALNVANATSNLPTTVKIPGVASTLVAVAAKTFGSGSPKLVSSDGDGNFETFSLARALETTYNNRLDSYKPFAPPPISPEMIGNTAEQILETASIDKQTSEKKQKLGSLLNPESTNLAPTVEKLLPEGVIRIRPSDLAPAPPTEYRTNTAGTANITLETARADSLLPLPVDRGAPTLHNTIIAERATNRIIICDLAERMPVYETIIDRLDVPPKLVEISATILDVDANSALEWGVDWAGLGKEEITEATGTALSTFDGGLRLGGELATNGLRGLTSPSGNLTADKVFHPTGLNVSTLIMGTSGRLAARLQALETNGKAQVLSRPVLLTVANTDALFYDNSSLVLPVPGEFNADLFKLNAPLALRVRPVVMETGKEPTIFLEVEIKDDALTSTSSDGSTAAKNKAVALLSESTIQTRAMIQMGQSLLLGGRYRHIEQKRAGAVPLLSRIPLLGLAFKDRQNTNIKLQRLFLITPRLVAPSSAHPLGPSLPPSPPPIPTRPPLPASPFK